MPVSEFAPASVHGLSSGFDCNFRCWFFYSPPSWSGWLCRGLLWRCCHTTCSCRDNRRLKTQLHSHQPEQQPSWCGQRHCRCISRVFLPARACLKNRKSLLMVLMQRQICKLKAQARRRTPEMRRQCPTPHQLPLLLVLRTIKLTPDPNVSY